MNRPLAATADAIGSVSTASSPSTYYRWGQLLMGIVCMAMIANLQYGWTLFVNPISEKHGWSRAAIQVAFTIFVLTETWLVPIEGYLVDKFGPRPVVLAGGILCGLGWVLNSYATTLTMLYIAAAVGGIGAGAVYGTCVGNALKWFPDRRGLAAGLTAAGFGAGSALTIIPISAFIKSDGYEAAFFYFGIGQGLVVFLLAWFGSTVAFGTLLGDRIHEHRGSMFGAGENAPEPTGREWPLHEVRLLCPVQPTKVIALWNNFAALGAKLNLAVPVEPLYLLKAPNSFAGPGDVIRQPRSRGKVVFEGELGIVIGREASGVAEAEAMAHVFGYTCANDVTEAEILNRDASFTQWVRAKGLDTFCPMGPVVATGLDPATLAVTTTLNDDVRQNYPVSDMRFSVAQLVSLISQDMTLYPGDVILCGTSIGVGSMKPGSDITVEIAGIGALRNRYE